VASQRSYAGLPAAERNVYVQIALDGTVRTSGVGLPPWDKLVAELPMLDSFQTVVSDGIGPSDGA